MNSYYIYEKSIHQIDIMKSKFISILCPISEQEDVEKILKDIKKEYPKARHYIYAYILDQKQKSNDDGEPSGTAGLPVLDVFKKNDITNFVCIVVRYFGGIKLGAGGLVRAYSSSASLALKEAGIAPIINYSKVTLIFSYGYMNIIENKLRQYEIIEKDFTTNVMLTIKIPTNEVDMLKQLLISLTNNQIIIQENAI
jgi:uncharacterized YigZ family protein